jgi:hypothetical protein
MLNWGGTAWEKCPTGAANIRTVWVELNFLWVLEARFTVGLRLSVNTDRSHDTKAGPTHRNRKF